MGVRRTSLRLLVAASLATLACVCLPGGATAHHPLDEAMEALALPFDGEAKRIFNSRLAAAPPMEGVGENMELVANVPLGPGDVPGGADDHDQFTNNAADIELAGNHLFVGSYTQGLVIINVASCNDPIRPDRCKPFVESVLPCSGGQFDIQLSPDADIAVMAHESPSANKDCHPNEEGAQIIDVSNRRNPQELSFISDRRDITPQDPNGESSGIVEDGAHNTTLDWPYLYIDQYQPTYGTVGVPPEDMGKAEVFDLSNPRSPQLVSSIDFAGPNGETGFHDSYPDHRPDGKHLLYGASIQKSDIVDISNPAQPKELQTIADPQVGISHGAEPNWKRDVLIVTDEYGGGTGVAACGGGYDGNDDPAGGPPPIPGYNPVPNGVGAVHFYKLDPVTGLVPTNIQKHGVFNIDYQANTPDQVAAQAGCTSHVFWQAPNENRMTIAWYGRGTRIVDFNDPANPREIGHFIPKGADTWSAKPHCGYIFTGDMVRGVDVLRYTGEGGNAWPTTSGKADLQRAATQGAPAPQTASPCRFPASASGGGTGPDYSVPSCANAARRAGRRNIGRVSLGQRRAQVRRVMRSRGAYRRFMDRWCLRGGGALRVGYHTPRQLRAMPRSQRRRSRGRANLVLSSSRLPAIARVRRGTTTRALRGRVTGLRAVRVGRNIWFTRRVRSATQVFKVQRGRVREIGLADRRLTRTPPQVRRFFRAVR